MADDIQYDVKDGIARLTIQRPEKLNALRVRSVRELREALATANADANVGVSMITGAGDRAFCSGGELSFPLDPKEDREFMREALRLSEEMRGGGKPIVARVNGWCIGAGNELNMLCDLSVAADTATFGHTGPRIGSSPVWYGLQTLLASVGEKRTREIVYLCRRYSAAEALAMGWINAVAPAEELTDRVEAICREVLDKGPAAIRLAKLYINSLTDSMHSTVYQGIESILMLHETEEAAEGMSAFAEKRPADYSRFR